MGIILRPKMEFVLPVDADCITPDEFAGKGLEDIAGLSVYRGSQRSRIDDLFEIEGDVAESLEDVRIVLEGDLSMVKRIGEKMSGGEIVISGDVGMHAGAFMSGGRIVVNGDAGSWAGQQMSDGEIQIKGNAGDFLGSTLRGDWIGMKGGRITVDGDAGNEVGEWMDDGIIEIGGDAGLHLGAHMKGGAIVVRSDVGDRAGSQMKGGDLVVMGEAGRLLPGFKFEEEVKEIELEDGTLKGEFLRFSGDMAEGGEGNLYVSKEKNEDLLET